MDNTSYTFSSFNEYASDGVAQALKRFNPRDKKLIIICVGSDMILGDSLGPLVGTMLKRRNVSAYVYGTLNYPITAKEVDYAKRYLKQMHPDSVAIAIDAAVGNNDDIGLLRVINKGLKPGLGVDKNLEVIGDISIIGIVAGKSLKNYNLFNLTRLNLVYKMAERIADGIDKYIAERNPVKDFFLSDPPNDKVRNTNFYA